MKLVISPSKSLNYESELPFSFSTESSFFSEAQQLNDLLKKKLGVLFLIQKILGLQFMPLVASCIVASTLIQYENQN